MIQADKRALHQILVNLLPNAVKFTPEGGRIGVRVRARRRCRQHLRRGHRHRHPARGAAEAGPPVRAGEDGRQQTHDGSGLGLAIARSLAELHGGGLRIRSCDGIGTIVLVHLPTKAQTGLEIVSGAMH